MKAYESLEMEVVFFDHEDIITESTTCDGEIKMPDQP